MKTLAIIFSLVLISSIAVLPDAYSQSARQTLKQLENEGRTDCEVLFINDFLYKPVRINIVHEAVDTQNVKITSDDPESKVFWDGSKESFQMVTSSTDRHRLDLELEYSDQKDKSRVVYFQIFAKDRTLMYEGNWVHEGTSFCKIIEFFTQEAPDEITEEEIIAINNAYNLEQATINALKFTTIETGLLVILVIVSVVGIMTTLYFMIILVSNRAMKRVANRPVAKLNEMTVKLGKQTEVFKLLLQLMNTKDDRFKEQIMARIDASLYDLRDASASMASAKKKIEIGEAFPKSKSMLLPDAPEQVKKPEELVKVMIPEMQSKIAYGILSEDEIKELKNQSDDLAKEEQIDAEKLIAKEYGVEYSPIPDHSTESAETQEATFADSIEPDTEVISVNPPTEEVTIEVEEIKPDGSEGRKDKITGEVPVHKKFNVLREGDKVKPIPEKPKEDENTVSFDPKDVKPCACGETATFYCKDCEDFFCDKHEDHDCLVKKKSKGTLQKIIHLTKDVTKDIPVEKIVGLIASKEKVDALTSDDEIDRLLDDDHTKQEVIQMIKKYYLKKLPFKEADQLYRDLQDDYKKQPTYPLSIRMEGLMLRLIESDR